MRSSPRLLRSRRWPALFVLACFSLVATLPLHAGTPLICHPYAIGNAATLPGTDGDWKGVNPNYDRTHLVRDTLALLKPDTPVIVRMETLRRAAIYATAGMRGWGTQAGVNDEDRANALALLEQFRKRSKNATGSERALALFDLGFFTETLRQTRIDPTLDGYAILQEAAKLRGSDADMEFALALASAWPKRQEHHAHVARARALAKPGSLVATNLTSHLGGS